MQRTGSCTSNRTVRASPHPPACDTHAPRCCTPNESDGVSSQTAPDAPTAHARACTSARASSKAHCARIPYTPRSHPHTTVDQALDMREPPKLLVPARRGPDPTTSIGDPAAEDCASSTERHSVAYRWRGPDGSPRSTRDLNPSSFANDGPPVTPSHTPVAS
eukprot:1865512-Prymnesium_polylepis.1